MPKSNKNWEKASRHTCVHWPFSAYNRIEYNANAKKLLTETVIGDSINT